MSVVEQLTEYCDCQEVNEQDVYELINLVSSYTGWMQETCETFLLGERKEVIDLPSCKSDCSVMEFDPFYQPFDYESFTFYLVAQDGINEDVTEITDVRYSPVDGNFRIDLPLPNCDCNPQCGCEVKYKLLVTYTAGYEEIPECLLPLFCEGLQWIADKNKCCSDCADCDTPNTDQGIDFTTLEGRLKDHFLAILTRQYFRALSLISLNKPVRHLWGIVV